MIKKFSQLVLGAFLLFFSTNAFALQYYASFRNTETQILDQSEYLGFPTEDINTGGAITRVFIGDRMAGAGESQHEFIINVPGNYLITIATNGIPTISPQATFQLLVNGVEQDRLTTNTATLNILPLQVGDVIRIALSHPTSGQTLEQGTSPNTETNTSMISFVKLDSAPAAGPGSGPGCSGGLL